MIAKLISGLVLLATPVLAAPAPAPAASPASSTGAVNTGRVLWGNIGLYDVGVSFNNGVGSFSSSTTNFGINVGAALNVAALTPDLALALWGNLAIAFATGGEYFPLTAGAAVRYDKLPVQLLGGLGFTLLPNSVDNSTLPLGLAIQAMGFYPLPMVHPNLSVDMQIAYHFLSDSYWMFTFTLGAGWVF